MKEQRHKVPLKLRLYRIKNIGFLTFTDKIIRFLKPPQKYNRGNPSKLLFIRNDKIGDALVTLPILRDLNLNYPDIEIHVLSSQVNDFVFRNHNYIKKIIIYEEHDSKSLFNILKKENYNAVIDLISRDKKLIWKLRKISGFFVGSRIFLLSWIYNYYCKTNWVSEFDDKLITKKIEEVLFDCFGFEFTKKDKSLPHNKSYNLNNTRKDYDILFHLGTSELRKLDFQKEKNLIESLKNFKILMTDGEATQRYNYYKTKYIANNNFVFNLYDHISRMIEDALNAKLILCYDGGQAHFLGQFTQTLVLVGMVNASQWAPYEFENYEELKTWQNGVKAIQSKGGLKHIAISYPIWCCPCSGIGCNTRPCINNIQISQIIELINSCTNAGN